MSITVAVVSLSGCAKQDYSDPEAFAEKYFREELEKRYPAKEFLAPMHFKGIKLSGFRRELKGTILGQLDYVTCDFDPIPESGVKYYIPYDYYLESPKIDFGDEKFDSLWSLYFDAISKSERDRLNTAIHRLRETRPKMVKEIVPRGGTISSYRAKNNDDVFEPVNMGGQTFNRQGSINGPEFCFTQDRLVGMRAVVLGSKEANDAIEAHKAKAGELKCLIAELNTMRKQLSEFENSKDVEIRKLEDGCSNRAYSRKRSIAKLTDKKKHEEGRLSRLPTEAQLATDKRHVRKRNRGRQPDTVESVTAKIHELEAQIETANAEAVKDKEQTEARIVALKALVAYTSKDTAFPKEHEAQLTETERSLLGEPSYYARIKPKLDRLHQLLHKLL